MRAVRFDAYGGPDVLRVEEVPDPTPGLDDVLIDVAAAGINPLDWKIRSGALAEMMPFPLPFILGWDVAGTVAAVGDRVSDLKVGDAVFGMIPIGAPGAYAEKAIAPAAALARMPEGLDRAAASVIPVVGLAAYQLVNGTSPVKAGHTVLVLGAAGNVGRLCVALAANADARVIATATEADLGSVDWPAGVQTRSLDGHSTGIDDFAVDVLIDTIGGPVLDAAIPSVRPGGHVRSTVQPPRVPKDREIEATMLQVAPDRDALNALGALLVAGTLPLPEITSFDLSDAAQAHAAGEAGHAGKLTLATR